MLSLPRHKLKTVAATVRTVIVLGVALIAWSATYPSPPPITYFGDQYPGPVIDIPARR